MQVKPVLVKPKSVRMKRDVVDIRPGMTVAELADTLGRDVGEANRLFMYNVRLMDCLYLAMTLNVPW